MGCIRENKEKIIKGGYLVEVVGSDGNNVLWEVVDNHVVEEKNDHDDIGPRGFDFNFIDEDKEGVGRVGLSKYHYLSMLTNPWPGDCKNHFKRMNMRVYEENGKTAGMVNIKYQKICRFSRNEFCKNIGFLVSATTFGMGGSRIWEKKEVQKINWERRGRGVKLG